jgi:hypothetical protein
LSFLHGRPFLLPAAAHTGAPRPVSTWVTDSGEPAPYELAVPVPGPGGGLLQNQGVIVLSRLATDRSEPFGQYELALLRNVALRVALLRGSIMVNEAADLVRQSANAFAMAEPDPAVAALVTAVGDSAPREHRPPTGLPADFAPLIPTLQVVLETISRLTASDSAAFRLLTFGDIGRDAYRDLVLRRVAAWPQPRLDDDHAVIRLNQRASRPTSPSPGGSVTSPTCPRGTPSGHGRD